MAIICLPGMGNKAPVQLFDWVEGPLLAAIKNDALVDAPWFAGHVLKAEDQHFRTYFKDRVVPSGLVLNNFDVRIAQVKPRRYIAMFDLPKDPCVSMKQVVTTYNNGVRAQPSAHDLRQIASYTVQREIAEVSFRYQFWADQPCVTGMVIKYFEK